MINIFKAVRIFETRQRPRLSRNVQHYEVLPFIDIYNDAFLDEWTSNWNEGFIEKEGFETIIFWKQHLKDYPILSSMA